MKVSKNGLLKKIEILLEEEERRLRSADLVGFEDFLRKKTEIIKELENTTEKFSQKEIMYIKKEIARNDQLYSAVLAGLRLGIERVKDIYKAVEKLNIYDNCGQLQSEKTTMPKLFLKA